MGIIPARTGFAKEQVSRPAKYAAGNRLRFPEIFLYLIEDCYGPFWTVLSV